MGPSKYLVFGPAAKITFSNPESLLAAPTADRARIASWQPAFIDEGTDECAIGAVWTEASMLAVRRIAEQDHAIENQSRASVRDERLATVARFDGEAAEDGIGRGIGERWPVGRKCHRGLSRPHAAWRNVGTRL